MRYSKFSIRSFNDKNTTIHSRVGDRKPFRREVDPAGEKFFSDDAEEANHPRFLRSSRAAGGDRTLHSRRWNRAERRESTAVAFRCRERPKSEARNPVAAEAEEKEFYEHRAPKAWLDALSALGTDWRKPFLEIAPWLIAVFAQPFRILPDGTRSPTYYPLESVGIATGLLVTALHSCGLAALTHAPAPMGFLNRILGRPSHEKAFVLLVVGHPAENALVPDITRKSLEEISSFVV